ncbi:MAG: MarR family transcriptional regulator [Clostridia bacterium]|nr:MarR family transcriptional regulator [Clostridia bacterium]
MEKELGEYFREINTAVYNKLEERLAKYELVKGQARLLLLIKDNDGCTQKELANFVGVKYSSMSERLNKLERNGYIERVSDEENMKYKRIFITPEGKTAVVQCRKILKEIDEQIFKGMTKKDKVQFETYLNKIIKNLSK